MKKLLLYTVLLFSAVLGYGQNLVTNGSFEQYSQCPFDEAQIEFSINWENYCGTPEYFNSCATNANYSVPYNFFGSYQPASDGQAYAGVFTYFSYWSWGYFNLRENIAYQLNSQLIPGTKYYVSFKASLAYNNFSAYCATNNLGAKFTTQSYSNYAIDSLNTPLTNNFAHIYSTSIITDSINWTTIKGSFIADSAYNYVVIGNFFDDAHTDTTVFNTGANTCQAYYYIDEVCVSPDSSTCGFTTKINLYNIETDVNIYPNPCSDYFEIMLPENFILKHKVLTIHLINTCGQEFFNTAIKGSNKIRVATREIPRGTYLLKIEMENQNILNKVIIVN